MASCKSVAQKTKRDPVMIWTCCLKLFRWRTSFASAKHALGHLHLSLQMLRELREALSAPTGRLGHQNHRVGLPTHTHVLTWKWDPKLRKICRKEPGKKHMLARDYHHAMKEARGFTVTRGDEFPLQCSNHHCQDLISESRTSSAPPSSHR